MTSAYVIKSFATLRGGPLDGQTHQTRGGSRPPQALRLAAADDPHGPLNDCETPNDPGAVYFPRWDASGLAVLDDVGALIFDYYDN